MKLKDALRFMFFLFCAVSTFETLFIATLGFINNDIFVFEAKELYKIPFVAFMSVLPVFVMIRSETAPRPEWIARKALHFILTAGVVFTLLIYFKWIDKQNVLLVAIFFLFIYITAFAVQEIRAKRLADAINKRINAFHESENATHRGGG